jgi:hypothetical protein
LKTCKNVGERLSATFCRVWSCNRPETLLNWNSKNFDKWLRNMCVIFIHTPNITGNIPHAWLYECAVGVLHKKLKLTSDLGDSGSKKCK